MSNEIATAAISGLVTIIVALIAVVGTLVKNKRDADKPISPVDDYEKLVKRLITEVDRLNKRVETLEQRLDISGQELQTARNEAINLRARVIELEASEVRLKAEIATLREKVEKNGKANGV